MQTNLKSKKDVFSVYSGDDGDVGFPALSTQLVNQLIFGIRRGVLHLFLALDRDSHYNSVHTPVLHQRVEDSAK